MTRITTCALMTALLAFGTTARADHEDHHKAHLACAKACDDCARMCDNCAAHCTHMLAEGKKDHLATLRTCQDCATICRAAAASAARGGPFVDLICTACADCCKKCGDACAKFKDDKHMTACAEECRKCEKACREMLKHAKH